MSHRSSRRTYGGILTATGIALSFAFALSLVDAQSGGGQPSAKNTVKFSGLTMVDSTYEYPWTTLLSNSMHVANNKDVITTVSLECGLLTSTFVASGGNGNGNGHGNNDTSTAAAAVIVRVLVDGEEAAPGPVVFARRMQELTADFQGFIPTESNAVDQPLPILTCFREGPRPVNGVAS